MMGYFEELNQQIRPGGERHAFLNEGLSDTPASLRTISLLFISVLALKGKSICAETVREHLAVSLLPKPIYYSGQLMNLSCPVSYPVSRHTLQKVQSRVKPAAQKSCT